MQLDFTSPRPIFLQVAEVIEDGILSGAYPEETQIPSITEFSVSCQINPATALKGINLLVDAGVLYKKRGVGMFVAADARKRLRARHSETFYTDFVLPMVAEAIQLDIPPPEVSRLVQKGFDERNDDDEQN